MKCPNCNTNTKVIGNATVPSVHLCTGVSVMWCPECGTTFKNTHFLNKANDIMIPKKLMRIKRKRKVLSKETRDMIKDGAELSRWFKENKMASRVTKFLYDSVIIHMSIEEAEVIKEKIQSTFPALVL